MPISEQVKSTPAKTYLFGYPLKRTYAPLLHNTLTRLSGVPRTYSKWETRDIEDILVESKKPEFVGSAVTMPHKVAVCALVDELTPEGKAIGACNTVFWRYEADGSRKLVGHNTDTIGVRDSFLQGDVPRLTEAQTKPGLIMGGGGASRAAVYALAVYLNCSPIYVINRDDSEVDAMLADFANSRLPSFRPEMIHVKTVEQAESLPAPAYIVSAIPDYPPCTDAEKNARACFEIMLSKPEKGAILEMCYNPRTWTDICQVAQDKFWTVITGDIAMIWQGIEQQKIWLNCPQEELPVKETFDRVRAQVESDNKTGADPPQE